MKPGSSIGVYSIFCAETGLEYVGSATDVPKRFGQHRTRLNNGNHENPRLQEDWTKFGQRAFIFRHLETCETIDLARAREASIIRSMNQDSLYNGKRYRPPSEWPCAATIRKVECRVSVYLKPETLRFLDEEARRVSLKSRSAAIEKIIEFYRRMTEQ